MKAHYSSSGHLPVVQAALISRLLQPYEERLLMQDNVPLGYFSIFPECSDLYLRMARAGIAFGTTIVVDGSVGIHWGTHWRDQALSEKFGDRVRFAGSYPSSFPQSKSNPHQMWSYPEEAVPTFKRWMRLIYLPELLPLYLNEQVRKGKLSPRVSDAVLEALRASAARRMGAASRSFQSCSKTRTGTGQSRASSDPANRLEKE